MAELVIEALRKNVPYLRKVVVVGYRAARAEFVEGGNSFVESLRNGLAAVDSDQFLLSAADLPFLTENSLGDFLEKCERGAAINYPIVPVRICEERFPGMKRTSIKIREGRFTGGNVALANTELMRSIFPVLEQAYENRKKPLKLARQIGIWTLVRVAMGQAVAISLPLSALERQIGQFLGAPVRAIITENAEIGADVDDLAQYRQAVKLLELQRGP